MATKKTQMTKIEVDNEHENQFGGGEMKILYFCEDGVELTPSTFKKTLTALIIYAYKYESSDPIRGGTMPLFNNNTHELCNSANEGDEYPDYVNLITSDDESGENTTITLDTLDMSYFRVMVVDMPVKLPF